MKKNKFSLIVPVYNTSKVLKRCIDSILNQNYDNYEVIIVNDGSTDNSLDIIKEYNDKRITVIDQKNQGLSEARNNGVKKATGDYLLFIDSDDSVNKELLNELNNHITNEELIRFQIKQITGDNEVEYHEKEFTNLNGIDAFKEIDKYHFFETAVCYAYNRKYYLDNKYSFEKGAYHEDFGLLPEIIINCNNISSIDYIGYNYYTNEGSITSFTSYEKEVKKAWDIFNHYKRLKNKSNDLYYLSFISNAVLLKVNFLKGKERKEYLKEIKNLKVIDNLLEDTPKRKLKKILLKLFPSIFVRGLK